MTVEMTADHKRNTKTIFLDTNIALHYKRLDQVDWCVELDCANVVFVVAPVFLTELEKHKVDNPNKKIRKRAGDYSAWLLTKFEEAVIRKGVTICFLANEPMNDFEKLGLDRRIADDRLIASSIEFALQRPETDVAVMTADLGLTLKLKLRKLPVISPSKSCILPDELSEEEQEIKELRQQLSKFTNRLPRLSIQFVSDKTMLPLLRLRLIERSEFIKDGMESVRKKFPKSSITSPPGAQFEVSGIPHQLAQLGRSVQRMSLDADLKYDAELDVFYAEYETYLQRKYSDAQRWGSMTKLDLRLSNTDGTAQATNVDVFLKCLDSGKFLTLDQRPGMPEPPTKPEKKNFLGMSSSRLLDSSLSPRLWDGIKAADPTAATLTTENGRAAFFVPNLKHRQSLDLMPVWLDFGSIDSMSNLTIEYEIHATEIMDPVIGRVHIIVE